MKKIFFLIFIFIFTNSSYAKERFIPIELWLGIPSTGSNERGSKVQLFTITNNGQCLGRVWDSRKRKRGVVVAIDNGCKFPLGNWKEGETRDFFQLITGPKKNQAAALPAKELG